MNISLSSIVVSEGPSTRNLLKDFLLSPTILGVEAKEL